MKRDLFPEALQLASIEEMIERAVDHAGGEDYFVWLAEEHPTIFLAILGKVLPMTLSVDAPVCGPGVVVSLPANARA